MAICKARTIGERESGLRQFCESIPAHRRGLLVEVGSWLGESACIFAEYFRQVVAVDPWDALHAKSAGCTVWLAGHTPDEVYAAFLDQVAPFDNIAWLRMTGEQSARLFGDLTCDVVYLDADHGEAETAREIKTWMPKVRPLGILAGHDYGWAMWPGVQLAVDRIFKTPDAVYPDTTWKVQL